MKKHEDACRHTKNQIYIISGKKSGKTDPDTFNKSKCHIFELSDRQGLIK